MILSPPPDSICSPRVQSYPPCPRWLIATATDELFVARECGGLVAVDWVEFAALKLDREELEDEVMALRHRVAELEGAR
jgi:hypothetical protein